MVRFFSFDGPLYRILTVIYKYISLNVLYLLFCIPIVTIPASTAGLFAVSRKYVYRDDPRLFRTFWRGFRENFVQSSLVGLLIAVAMLILLFDMHSLIHAQGLWSVVVIVMSTVISAVFLIASIHTFSIMVHMHMSTLELLTNTLKLSLIKPIYNILNVILIVGLFYLSNYVPILFILGFFSVSATLSYWFANRKFKDILPHEKNTN